MMRLNRTTEYGLIALRHMSRKASSSSTSDSAGTPARVTSAREISDSYGLPFEITAKTLQRLRDTGIIQSEQGARGGYSLKKKLTDVSLAEFLELMEGPQSFVACAPTPAEKLALMPRFDHAGAPDAGANPSTAQATTVRPSHTAAATPCEYKSKCEIQGIMGDLNSRIFKFMAGICLAEITDTDAYLALPAAHAFAATASAGTPFRPLIGDEP